jgi:hypothetical protein
LNQNYLLFRTAVGIVGEDLRQRRESGNMNNFAADVMDRLDGTCRSRSQVINGVEWHACNECDLLWKESDVSRPICPRQYRANFERMRLRKLGYFVGITLLSMLLAAPFAFASQAPPPEGTIASEAVWVMILGSIFAVCVIWAMAPPRPAPPPEDEEVYGDWPHQSRHPEERQ